jgi:hypothetical protein
MQAVIKQFVDVTYDEGCNYGGDNNSSGGYNPYHLQHVEPFF